MAVGGDILEVTYNHETLGSGTFFPKAEEDSTYDLGGFTSNDDAGGIDGGGNMIDKMTRKRPFFEVVLSWDMNTKQELEKLAALQASPIPADWDITHVNGSVYRMKGKPVGDVQGNPTEATTNLKVAGGGQMKKII